MSNLPILWIDKFHKTNFFSRRKLKKIIDSNHNDKTIFASSMKTFMIEDEEHKITNFLYDKFLKVCSSAFGTLETDEHDCRFVSTFKGEYKNMKVQKDSWWHVKDGITIDSIYFLSTPKNGIAFFHNGVQYIENPKSGDLLIFPPNLIRAYTPSINKKCRYSINMGIKLNTSIEYTFNKLSRLQKVNTKFD